MNGLTNAVDRLIKFTQASSKRCHVTGFSLSLVVIGLIAWTSQNGDRMWSGKSTLDGVTANQASYLCEHSTELREKYSQAVRREKEFRRRVEQQSDWVAATQNLEQEFQRITTAAVAAGLIIGDFSEPKTESGFRVGVTQTDFAVTGDFASICKFIEQLAAGERPVWCTRAAIRPYRRTTGRPETSAVQMATSDVTPAAKTTSVVDSASNMVVAHLTIRIPFAETASAAGKLDLSGSVNGI